MLPAGPFGTPEEQTTGQFPDSVHQGQVGLFVTPTAVGQYSIPPPGDARWQGDPDTRLDYDEDSCPEARA